MGYSKAIGVKNVPFLEMPKRVTWFRCVPTGSLAAVAQDELLRALKMAACCVGLAWRDIRRTGP